MLPALLSHFAAACTSNTTFLGLVPWYHYLQVGMQNGSCQVTNFQLLGSNGSLVLILMAIIDDLLRIAGLAAVLVIIYGGIKYITSGGSPDKTASAQSTVINSLIGLAIALIAIQFVSFLGNRLAGGAGSAGSGNVGGATLVLPLPNITNTGSSFVQIILTIIFGIAGALAFAFLIYGGFKYVMSQGDPQAIGKAKSTILYALIGIIVVLLGQAIVSFIVGRIGA